MSRLRAAWLLALLALAGLPAAGCGGEDQAARKPPPAPELTVPRTQPERTGTAPATNRQPDGSSPDPAVVPGPGPAPPEEGDGGSGGTRPPRPDSPQNDTPPPPGSPADRFEKDCEARKACG